MSEGSGDEVEGADKTIARDSMITLVPGNDRSFEHGLRFVHLLRLPRFSPAAYIDPVNVNLLTRLFQTRRSP